MQYGCRLDVIYAAQCLAGPVPLQAHLKAEQFYSVVANMRGDSPEEVARKLLSSEGLRGLQVCNIFHYHPYITDLPFTGRWTDGRSM